MRHRHHHQSPPTSSSIVVTINIIIIIIIVIVVVVIIVIVVVQIARARSFDGDMAAPREATTRPHPPRHHRPHVSARCRASRGVRGGRCNYFLA
jgi:short subunit fatty acids transporter